jgi:hypothetical protein
LDIDCEIVATDILKNPDLDEIHSFLHVHINRKDFLCDPVNNFFFELKDLELELKRIEKPMHFHKNTKPLYFELEY